VSRSNPKSFQHASVAVPPCRSHLRDIRAPRPMGPGRGMSRVRFTVAASTALLVALAMVASSAFAADETPNITSRDLRITGFELQDGNLRRDVGEFTINIADCRTLVAENPEMTFVYTLSNDPPAGARYAIKLEPPQGSCSRTNPTTDGDGEGCTVLTESGTLTGRTVEQTVNARTLLQITDPAECLATSGDRDYRVLFIFSDRRFTGGAGGGSQEYDFTSIRGRLSTSRPNAPTLRSVSAGSRTLQLRWDAVDGADIRYRAYFSTEPFDGTANPEEVSGVSRSSTTVNTQIRIDGDQVVEGATYYVAVVALNTAGNPSSFSEIQQVVTQPTTDFFQLYKDGGGQEAGGHCSAASAPTSRTLALMLGLAFIATRSRKWRTSR